MSILDNHAPDRPAVSVVVPTYNRAAFIAETINSVCRDTLRDVQIVVIDDGSTDTTANVVHGIDDRRVDYRFQVNRGLAAARNAGLRAASAPLIAFLDSDDLITGDKLAVQATFLEHNPELSAVYSRWNYIDAFGRTLVDGDGIDHTADFLAALSISNFAPIHSYLFRRSAVAAIGGFSEDLDGCGYEDWDLLLRLATSGARLGFLPQVTASYRMHGQNMCSVSAESLCRCGMDVISKMHPRSGVARSLPAALVHMEACSQLYRRGLKALAADYGSAALSHHRELAFDEMFFHYLATFDAPPELGHAAFTLYRHASSDRIEHLLKEVLHSWAPKAHVIYSPDDHERASTLLRGWLSAI